MILIFVRKKGHGHGQDDTDMKPEKHIELVTQKNAKEARTWYDVKTNI